jgi:hypothetical protein
VYFAFIGTNFMSTNSETATFVPAGIAINKETMVSPLTNASVASSVGKGEKPTTTKKSTAASAVTATTKKKLGLAVAAAAPTARKKTTAAPRAPPAANNKRKSSASTSSRAGSTTPTRQASNKARRTTAGGGADTGAPKRSPRIQELEKLAREALEKRNAILHGKKHIPAGGVATGAGAGAAGAVPAAQRNITGALLHADDEDDDEALSLEEDEDGTTEVLEEEDIDDAMMIADIDPTSGAKQTLAKKATVKYEKQFVSLTPRKGKRITAVSFAKGYFHMPKVNEKGRKLLEESETGQFQYALSSWFPLSCSPTNSPLSVLTHHCLFIVLSASKKYPGLWKIYTKDCTACCVACFNNDMKPLNTCIVVLKNWNNSNCKQHMSTHHKEDIVGKQYRIDTAESGEAGALSLLKKESSGASSVARALAEQDGGDSVSVRPFLFSKTKIPKLIIQRANDLQLQYMRATNMAARHGNSAELRNYLDHILDNAYFFSKNRSLMLMGRTKVSNQRYRSFNQLVSMVKTMVDRSRVWLQQETHREHVPFITVGHDGWDSKDKDMLGVCCHFVDMDRGKLRTIALGLQQAYSKKSVDTAQHTLKILERYVPWLLHGARGEDLVLLFITHLLCALCRYGIHQDEVIDTQASPIIVPKGGTACQMHAMELVLKHSHGLTC